MNRVTAWVRGPDAADVDVAGLLTAAGIVDIRRTDGGTPPPPDLAEQAEAVLVIDARVLRTLDVVRLIRFHRGHEDEATLAPGPDGGIGLVLTPRAFRAFAAAGGTTPPTQARRWEPPAARRPPRPAVFLDRDGTLIEEVHYLADPARVRVLPGVAEGLIRLAAAGFALVVASNQSGVGRGLITTDQLRAVDAEMVRQLAGQGARLDALYACTDAPRGDDPPHAWRGRRKPGPGMLCEAAAEHGLDLTRSWIVGDMVRDLLAGANAGCPGGVLVRTGKGRSQEGVLPDLPRLVADDFAGAAAAILAARDGTTPDLHRDRRHR